MQWKELSEVGQIDSIIKSSTQPDIPAVAVFKHSTRCSISGMAKSRLERKWDLNQIPVFLLDLLNHRDISQALTDKFEVKHESPQILLIKDGKCIYHASHGDITVEAIDQVLERTNK